MYVLILPQVQKTLRKETKEIIDDVNEVLEMLVGGSPVGMPHVKSLYNIYLGLFEIRVKDERGQFRVIYFVRRGDTIYLIHAFRKKTQEIKKKEKQVIIKRIKEILNGEV